MYPTLGHGVSDSLLMEEVAAGVAAELAGEDVAVVVITVGVVHLATHPQLASHT